MPNISEINDEDDQLYEHHAFKVEKGQQAVRIDKYLMNFILLLSYIIYQLPYVLLIKIWW